MVTDSHGQINFSRFDIEKRVEFIGQQPSGRQTETGLAGSLQFMMLLTISRYHNASNRIPRPTVEYQGARNEPKDAPQLISSLRLCFVRHCLSGGIDAGIDHHLILASG